MVGVKDEHASACRDAELAGCEQRATLFARKQTYTRIYMVRFSRPVRRHGKRGKAGAAPEND